MYMFPHKLRHHHQQPTKSRDFFFSFANKREKVLIAFVWQLNFSPSISLFLHKKYKSQENGIYFKIHLIFDEFRIKYISMAFLRV
jgi:hypothetical protein